MKIHIVLSFLLQVSPDSIKLVKIGTKLGCAESGKIRIGEITMQLTTAVALEKKYIEYVVDGSRLPNFRQSTSGLQEPNAFSVLMKTSKNYCMPKKPDASDSKKMMGPQKLYGDLIDWGTNMGFGWTPDIVEQSGKQVMKSLTNALWYVDHCHEKLKENGCPIPKTFDKFQNYNKYKSLRHRAPVVKSERLEELVADLVSAMNLPSMSENRNKRLAQEIDDLAQTLNKYKDRLNRDNKAHKSIHHQKTNPNTGDTNTSYIEPVVEANVKEEYKELNSAIKNTSDFLFLDLDKYCPENRIDRRKFLKDLRLSKPVMLHRVAYGGSIGTLNFVWSVPPGDTADRFNRNVNVISEIAESLPKFSSRAMRKDFIDKYSSFTKCPKSILRHMFSTLTGCEEMAINANEKEINERVSKMMEADDTDLLFDLRATNGSDTYYDVFFEEMGKYFDEQLLQVNDRRKGEELYLPLAISIETLKKEIVKRVPDGTPIPSSETIRLQFSPSNPFYNTALKYSGKFNVKFRVQVRQGRVTHQDSHYGAKYFQHMKEFCVKFRDSTLFLCLDDKAIVPVGEPGCPISTGVRGHNKVLAPSEGPRLVAADHDFHVGGIVPSVALVADIPENARDSFFSGEVHVTSKDKVFSPSSPLRHGVELIRLLRSSETFSEDAVNLNVPIMCLYTDGGPDHRTTYETVKLSLALIFMHLDLDMLVALRTAPSHSWTNPAERCMSILNLALQHVALDRSEMDEKFERMVKHLSTLSMVRNKAKLEAGFQEAFQNSMAPVIAKVNTRFAQMCLKGKNIITHEGMLEEEISPLLEILNVGLGTETPVASLETKSADLKKCKPLQVILHCHSLKAIIIYFVKLKRNHGL